MRKGLNVGRSLVVSRLCSNVSCLLCKYYKEEFLPAGLLAEHHWTMACSGALCWIFSTAGGRCLGRLVSTARGSCKIRLPFKMPVLPGACHGKEQSENFAHTLNPRPPQPQTREPLKVIQVARGKRPQLPKEAEASDAM